RRDGPIPFIDRLEDHPVVVDVETPLPAAEGHVHAFRSAGVLDDPAIEYFFDRGTFARGQALPTAPQPARRYPQTARLTFAGEKGKHRWIGGDELGLPFIEFRHQLGQGLEYREGTGRRSERGIQATLALPRHDAREMTIDRGDERTPRQPEPGQRRPRPVAEVEPARHERLVDRQRLGILDIHTRDARGTRTRPDRIRSQIGL